MTLTQYFDQLSALGLKAIPLRPYAKIPLCKKWADIHPDQNRYYLKCRPTSNIGLLLGEIVDVEGDSEEANQIIIDLIGDCPHPQYRSTKSIHHLFLNPDPNLTVLTHKKIEFRGHRHQSVLPPSRMSDGTEYVWLPESKFPVPPMPERLLAFYRSLRTDRRSPLKPGHMKIHCHECREECFLHAKRFQLEVEAFREIGQKWTCQQCRTIDLRPICRTMRKRRQVLN